MKDLFGLGYKLFTDNWYTSAELLRYLQENGTAACGTARRNRLLVPDSFKMSHLPKGEYRFRRNGNILAVRYNDKKEIYFLSSMHTMKVVYSAQIVSKLALIDDYNKKMGGVDKNDAIVGN